MASQDPEVVAARAAYAAARGVSSADVHEPAVRYVFAVMRSTGATWLRGEISPQGLHAITDLAAYLMDADDDPQKLWFT